MRLARVVLAVAAACGVSAPFAAAAQTIPEPEPKVRIGVRTSDDGVVLRVYRQTIDLGFPGEVQGGGPRLPEECFPDLQVDVQLSTREIAGQAFFLGHAQGAFAPQAQTFGQSEGAPVTVAIARLPEGADRARMRFDDGTTDSARALGDEWVVLASRITPPAAVSDPRRVPLLNHPVGKLRFLDADGQPVGDEVTVRSDLTGTGACGIEPVPVPLPTPTGRPPADEGAARQAVTDAYELVYTADQDIGTDERLAGIEDGESVRGVLDQIRELYPDVGPVKLKIDKIVFLNDHEAAVRFDLLLDGHPVTAQTAGRARLIGGEWKVAKSTYCEVVGRGGIVC